MAALVVGSGSVNPIVGTGTVSPIAGQGVAE